MPQLEQYEVYARECIAIQGVSAVRIPLLLKTSTFSIQDCENTFNMSAIYPIAPQIYK